MTKFMSSLLATTLSVSFALAAVVPVNAAPAMPSVSAPAASSDVQQVQERRLLRRHFRRGPVVRRDVIIRRGDGHYWRGHRGYRYHRPGYRRHGDLWFPLAAFATGAIISGAIINDRPPVYRGGNAHVQWCYDRYRSYRAWDNTFQPYNGPRQQCYSPYS